jgi:type VI secretion system secreted protein VgrG
MPMKPTDRYRGLRIDSPLGENIVCRRLTGREELGRLFEYELELLSLDMDIPFADIVGQKVTLTMDLAHGGKRYFDGYITEFAHVGTVGQFACYHASLKPWLWFLTRTMDCRIFQNQKAPDIIKSIFRDNGMGDFKDLLHASYRDWEYCVQYRESDFEFVSRLMEQAGIYYYFEHEKGRHTLVLADGITAHTAFPGYETVPYFPPTRDLALRERDHIQQWSVRQGIVPDKFTIKDFDFRKPKVDLTSTLTLSRDHVYPIADREVFDYPGEYMKRHDGEEYVERRLQEEHAQHERVIASGDARGMCAGYLFTLEDYPRLDQNKQHLVIAVAHEIRVTELETSRQSGNEDFYKCELEVIDSAQQYRSRRITPRPVVQGPQTAIVVGPESEEIYCDEYGRVKVQFHWDRYGETDENSSCWVRVSQAWAGKGWGGIHIPRIGQEVLVSFLEGDPDRPLITGRVYNADNMPPYELSANKTQSGIRSRSTSDGHAGNFNEIRMEDRKGAEELYIQAEKDENILVKNDKSETVGHDETISVGNDRKENVGHDESLSIANNRTVTVGVDQEITVQANETETVGANMKLNIGANRSMTVGANEAVEVGGNSETRVAASDVTVVGANQTLSVGINQSTTVGAHAKLQVGATYDISAAAPITIKSGSMITLSAGGSMIQIGPQGVTIKTGAIVNVMGSLIKLN